LNAEETSDVVASHERLYEFPVEVHFPVQASEVSGRVVVMDENGFGLCSLPVSARARRPVEFYPSEILLPVPGVEQSTAFEKQCFCIADSGGALQLTPKEVPDPNGRDLSPNRFGILEKRPRLLA
jgi:hypothetical protein